MPSFLLAPHLPPLHSAQKKCVPLWKLNSPVRLTLPFARVVPPMITIAFTEPANPSSSLHANATFVNGPKAIKVTSPGYCLQSRIMAKAACSLSMWRASAASGRPASPKPS